MGPLIQSKNSINDMMFYVSSEHENNCLVRTVKCSYQSIFSHARLFLVWASAGQFPNSESIRCRFRNCFSLFFYFTDGGSSTTCFSESPSSLQCFLRLADFSLAVVCSLLAGRPSSTL